MSLLHLLPAVILPLVMMMPLHLSAADGAKGNAIEITLDDSGWGDWFVVFWNDWQTRNVTKATHLVFYMKVIEGDASTMQVCLCDDVGPGKDVGIGEFANVGKEWTKVQIPLATLEANHAQLKSVIVKRSAAAKAVIALDEIQFIGPAPQTLWGEASPHEAMQGTGGTTVEHRIVAGQP